MNGKRFVLIMVVWFLAAECPCLCFGEEPKTLTVKKIVFARDSTDKERLAVVCNQSCVPKLSSIEGENPRVVMDLKGVSRIPADARNVDAAGKLVQRVRSYWDKRAKTLRIVLDMEPSRYCMVRPAWDPAVHTFRLTIYEAEPLPAPKSGDGKDAGGPSPFGGRHITILRSETPDSEIPKAVNAAAVVPSLGEGRSQLDAGDFAAAVDTFTRFIAAHPRESQGYRLRGNAYDNMADRRKAVEDWKHAARLGDADVQSFLDFLQVEWK